MAIILRRSVDCKTLGFDQEEKRKKERKDSFDPFTLLQSIFKNRNFLADAILILLPVIRVYEGTEPVVKKIKMTFQNRVNQKKNALAPLSPRTLMRHLEDSLKKELERAHVDSLDAYEEKFASLKKAQDAGYRLFFDEPLNVFRCIAADMFMLQSLADNFKHQPNCSFQASPKKNDDSSSDSDSNTVTQDTEIFCAHCTLLKGYTYSKVQNTVSSYWKLICYDFQQEELLHWHDDQIKRLVRRCNALFLDIFKRRPKVNIRHKLFSNFMKREKMRLIINAKEILDQIEYQPKSDRERIKVEYLKVQFFFFYYSLEYFCYNQIYHEKDVNMYSKRLEYFYKNVRKISSFDRLQSAMYNPFPIPTASDFERGLSSFIDNKIETYRISYRTSSKDG